MISSHPGHFYYDAPVILRSVTLAAVEDHGTCGSSQGVPFVKHLRHGHLEHGPGEHAVLRVRHF